MLIAKFNLKEQTLNLKKIFLWLKIEVENILIAKFNFKNLTL